MSTTKITTPEQREAAANFLAGIAAPKPSCPEPGIYPGVSMADYLAWDAFSASVANELLEHSPLHAKWARDHVDPPKPYTDQGTAMHMAILEPERFAATYTECEGPWNRNPYKQAKEAVEASGKTPIKPEDSEAALTARQNVLAHPKLGGLFADPEALREVSIVFDMETCCGPVRCKIRPDLVSRRFGLCVDIKTTTNATRRAFLAVCRSLGYHRKVTFYLEGLAAAGFDCSMFLAAIEQEMPCGVVPYAFSYEVLNRAGLEIEHAARTWAECRSTNHYPGYDDLVVELGDEGDYL